MTAEMMFLYQGFGSGMIDRLWHRTVRRLKGLQLSHR